MPINAWITLFVLILIPEISLAYIGPGIGLTALGVILGVGFTFFLATYTLIKTPLLRIYRKIFPKKANTRSKKSES